MVCTLIVSADVANADVSGVSSDEEMAVLERCIEAARERDGDIAECKGTLSTRCLEAIAPLKPNRLDEALCIQDEAFAWDLIDMKLGTVYLERLEGRSGFSREDYIADLEARLAEARNVCFRFPVGAELKVVECTRDRAIGRVGLTYARLDESRSGDE